MQLIMKQVKFLLVLYFLISPVTPQSIAENVSLIWKIYRSFARGTRILRDISDGASAIMKATYGSEDDTNYQSSIDTNDKTSSGDIDTSDRGKVLNPVPEEVHCGDGLGDEDKQCQYTEESNIALADPAAETSETSIYDGCGAFGFHNANPHLRFEEMTSCCEQHNACYFSSCRVSKRGCDRTLSRCLYSVCYTRKSGKNTEPKPTKVLKKTCTAAAKLLYRGSLALSRQRYRDAQLLLKCNRKGQRYRKGR